MRFIPYILYLFLIAFYRTILSDIFSFGWAEIYLAALLVMLVALSKDLYIALWFGFSAGIIYDAPEPMYLGVHMLFLSVIGAATAQLKVRFNLESLKSRVLLLLGGLFVYAIPRTLIYEQLESGEFLGFLLRGVLLSIVYSTLIGLVFFMFQSGQISYKKLKSLF